MIVNKKTNGFMTRKDKPNENWLKNNDYFVVDDNSEIAKKILEFYPNIKLKIENEKIIDVEIDTYKKEIEEKQIEKEKLQGELSITSEKLIECFEHFLNKITNITNVTDLLKLDDYPHDLKTLLKERMEIRNRITELESEVESDG